VSYRKPTRRRHCVSIPFIPIIDTDDLHSPAYVISGAANASVSMVEMSASESRVYANFDPVSTVSVLFIHYTLVHVNLIVANTRRYHCRFRYM
jgi:hypothetical protein